MPGSVPVSACLPRSCLACADPQGRLRLLAVGPDGGPFREISQWAESEGALIERARDISQASRCLACAPWDFILPVLGEDSEQDLDWWVDVIDRLGERRPRLLPLAMRPSVNLALKAVELGVLDLLPVPVKQRDFVEALSRTAKGSDETPVRLPRVDPLRIGPSGLIAESPAMLSVYKTIGQVAPSTATVLLLGESGTGKELAARAVHQLGTRASMPFVAVNCAAIPENLLESELFGHEKGAFTGAVARKIGRFERANGGTLFLDEIGDMSPWVQSKILRAIQEREIERVGGGDPINIDVRIIAATNQDLRVAIEQGRFRKDLYYRLAVVSLSLPRLADRGEDLLSLTGYFVADFSRQYNKEVLQISDRALGLMRRHDWPGNVRELQNVIARAVLTAEDGTIRSVDLPAEWRDAPAAVQTPGSNGDSATTMTLRDLEAGHIAKVFANTGGRLSAASRILGIHRNTLTRKLREYDLD